MLCVKFRTAQHCTLIFFVESRNQADLFLVLFLIKGIKNTHFEVNHFLTEPHNASKMHLEFYGRTFLCTLHGGSSYWNRSLPTHIHHISVTHSVWMFRQWNFENLTAEPKKPASRRPFQQTYLYTFIKVFFLPLTFYLGHKHHWLPVRLPESRGRAHRRMPYFSCFDSMAQDKTAWLLHRGGWFSMADKMKANVHTRRCD